MQFIPSGLATGIGSLPFSEPVQAVLFVLENVPDIPHWPQLPQRGEKEGLIFQFLNPLVNTGLININNGRAFFDTDHPGWVERLTLFYSIYLEAETGDFRALEQFAFPPDAAAGFYAFKEKLKNRGPDAAILYLKGQLVGPLTAGFQVKDKKGRFAYYDDQLRDLLVKSLAVHAGWQAKELAALGRLPIIFIDEPAVCVYGQSDYITVTREMIINDLNCIIQAIHGAGALAGVHSCDAVDWSMLFESDTDIVNIDVYNYADSLLPYARDLKLFTERGGIMAWGIVPTSEKAFEENEASLLKRLQKLWLELAKRGNEIEILQRQSLITPACGTGLLSSDLNRRIYFLTKMVSGKVQTKDL